MKRLLPGVFSLAFSATKFLNASGSWVLIFGHEGTCVASEGRDAFRRQKFKGSTLPRFPQDSAGGSSLGGSGMKSL